MARKRVLRVEFDPESTINLTDDQLKGLTVRALETSVLSMYQFNVVKQAPSRKVANVPTNKPDHNSN